MTSIDTTATTIARRSTARVPLVLRLALREMRAGLRGFYVFVACMALGVAVITAVGALADAMRAGFEKQGEAILGGDVTLARMHQRASPAERAWIDARGRASETATMRSMARALDGSEQALIELKAVDKAYPLVGELRLRGGTDFAAAVHQAGSAVVDPLLLERMRLKVGDSFRLGATTVRIAAVVEKEPDTISDRVTYGPRVFVSSATLEATGLVQPGTLVRWRYALKLPASDTESLKAVRAAATAELPESGFLQADRRDPSPQVTRTLERLRQFLTLIGLTSLLIGGVGIANAVATFIDRRRKVIATMKALGASGRTVLWVFLTQVMAIASLGIAIGLAIGFAVPFVLDHFYGEALPIRAVVTISPWSVVSAALYGLLVAAVFVLWPLGRAELVRAGVLFREEVAAERVWPRPAIIALTVAAVAALALFAILTSDSPQGRALFLRRRRRRVRAVHGARRGDHAACPPLSHQEAGRAAPRDRQHRRARRADPLGRALARRRPVAAGRRRARRCLADGRADDSRAEVEPDLFRARPDAAPIAIRSSTSCAASSRRPASTRRRCCAGAWSRSTACRSSRSRSRPSRSGCCPATAA